MPTLPFPISYGPDWESPKKSQARTLKTDFGDGYGQRAGDGLNGVRDTWELAWTHLTPNEAQVADSFLKARGGHEAFSWAHPSDLSTRRWVCETWTRTPNDPAAHTLTATFVEVFDL